MKADGLDPLPTYIPPLEDPQTRPDLAARYPLQLLSPPRPQFLNSTFANSPRHRAAAGDPTIELSADDARSARAERRRVGRSLQRPGRFQARVALTDSVRPAWPSPLASTGTSSRRAANVNSTTSSALTDMGGGATFFDNLVEVRLCRPLAAPLNQRHI